MEQDSTLKNQNQKKLRQPMIENYVVQNICQGYIEANNYNDNSLKTKVLIIL